MEETLMKPACVTSKSDQIDAGETHEKVTGEHGEAVEGDKTSEKIECEKTGVEKRLLVVDQVGGQRTSSPGRANRATGLVDRPLNEAEGLGERREGEKTGEFSWKRQRTRNSPISTESVACKHCGTAFDAIDSTNNPDIPDNLDNHEGKDSLHSGEYRVKSCTNEKCLVFDLQKTTNAPVTLGVSQHFTVKTLPLVALQLAGLASQRSQRTLSDSAFQGAGLATQYTPYTIKKVQLFKALRALPVAEDGIDSRPYRIAIITPPDALPGQMLYHTSPEGEKICLRLPTGVEPGSILNMAQTRANMQWEIKVKPNQLPKCQWIML